MAVPCCGTRLGFETVAENGATGMGMRRSSKSWSRVGDLNARPVDTNKLVDARADAGKAKFRAIRGLTAWFVLRAVPSDASLGSNLSAIRSTRAPSERRSGAIGRSCQ